MSEESEPDVPAPSGLVDQLRVALGDRYEIEREVGAGGMGTVFLAKDLKHGRAVAIKVLKRRLGGSSGPERFQREISIAAQLTHPHIVPLHDSGVADDLPYYVMPFAEGETLEEHLAAAGALPFEEALSIAQDTAEALDYAHEQGVVHRDIKPANILLMANHALVTDFGVARALEAAALHNVTETQGAAVGTPAYMSPEQALDGDLVDGRSDVYSLGCVVYEMLTGERAFQARTAVGLMARHVQGTIPSLPSAESIPPRAAEAVERALAKNPDDRFATAGEFVAALRGDVHVPSGRRSGPLARRSVRAAAGISGTVALVALVATGAWWLGSRPTPLEGRPQSVAVMPFETSTSTDEERALAADLASDIGVELNQWDSIYAVPSVALAGPMFDLGLSSATLARVADGIEVARALDVQAMLVVQVESDEGALSVQATLYDVGTGRPLDRPIQSAGGNDLPSIARGIAYSVLGLDNPGSGDPGLHLRSSSPTALRAFERGRQALELWRLQEAEGGFRDAIAADSSFSLAYHRLALTLYWGNARTSTALGRVGDDITRWSAQALRTAAGLSTRDSLHVWGFHAFQEGDYPRARKFYEGLLEAQPTDVYAWIMMGSIEFEDPWLEESETGLRPRRSYNSAIEAFETALRLQPTFELGYGHLFEIHRRIARSGQVNCNGFARPRAELIPPWESFPPDQQLAFCAMVIDTAEWVTRATLRAASPEARRLGAERLFRQSLRMAERWTAFAPGEARPWEALSNVLMGMRRAADIGRPEDLQQLAVEAHAAAQSALAVSTDTASQDLYRLALLAMAGGDRRTARQTLAAAEALPGEAPAAAANLYAAFGQLREALRILPEDRLQIYLEIEEEGAFVGDGGAARIFDRLAVLAGVTLSEGFLAQEFVNMESYWTGPDYDDAGRDVLRRDALLRSLPAIIVDPSRASAWTSQVASNHPLWLALNDRGLSGDSVRSILTEAVLNPPSSVPPAPSLAFVAGQVALLRTDYFEAQRWFARLDSIAGRVDLPAVTWTLQAVGPYWLARAQEAVADNEPAIENYSRFIAQWAAGDDLAMHMVDDARARVSRLTRAP